MSDELKRLERRLQQQNSVNSQLESELAALQQTRLGVKISFDNNVTELRQLNATNRTLENKLTALQQTLQRQNATNRTLESELTRLQQQLNALEQSQQPLGVPSAAPLEPSQATSAGGVNDAQNSDAQQTQLQQLQRKLSRLQTRLQTLNDNTAALQTQTTASEAVYNQQLRELTTLESELAELNRWQLPLTNAAQSNG